MSYYFIVDEEYYIMDSTTRVDRNFSGTLSSHPTADRKTSSDNYKVDNPTVTFSGKVSSVKGVGNFSNKSPDEYEDILISAIENKSSVSLRYRVSDTEEDGWFITSYTANNDNKDNVSYEGLTSAVIATSFDITFERPRTASSLDVTIDIDPSYSDALSSFTRSSSATSGFSDSANDKIKSRKAEGTVLEGSSKSFAMAEALGESFAEGKVYKGANK